MSQLNLWSNVCFKYATGIFYQRNYFFLSILSYTYLSLFLLLCPYFPQWPISTSLFGRQTDANPQPVQFSVDWFTFQRSKPLLLNHIALSRRSPLSLKQLFDMSLALHTILYRSWFLSSGSGSTIHGSSRWRARIRGTEQTRSGHGWAWFQWHLARSLG